MKVGLIGRGFVGDALYKAFSNKGMEIRSFDKYKKIGKLSDVLNSDIIFLCLPTPFKEGSGFDKSSLNEICKKLSSKKFKGLVVIKSTVEPGTCHYMAEEYGLSICHNPEFLTARTNYEDFENQKHIVLGYTKEGELFNNLIILYKKMFKDAKISICKSFESETMKIFCNSFYAVKVQFFNELYLLCNNFGANYETVTSLIINNGWVNPMHTKVPGPDGQLSYGGACFPKDTKALEKFMVDNNLDHAILSAAIKEREVYRND
tara:strand:- start:6404 stop:7189 length:786 start_codon:yes stop_codon:yes gene_type:complete